MNLTVDTTMSGIQAFRKGNLVYFAIPKNALCSYIGFFEKRRWQRVNINELALRTNPSTIYFGHIRHPLNRYVMAITQSLVGEHLSTFIPKMKKDPEFLKFIITSVNDDHTCPVSRMIPPTISPYQVKWIPMDHPKYDVDLLTNQTFHEFNLPYRVGKDDRAHISCKLQKDVQNFIRKEIMDRDLQPKDGYNGFAKAVLGEDLFLYKHVMENYKIREKYYDEVLGNLQEKFKKEDEEAAAAAKKLESKIDDRPSVLLKN